MEAPLAEFLAYLAAHEVRVGGIETAVRRPDLESIPEVAADPTCVHDLGGDAGSILEYRDPARRLRADHVTLDLAHGMIRQAPSGFAGKNALELGCGSGVLSVVAARLGARRVVATEIDPAAVELARRTAAANDVRVDLRPGSLFDPIGADETFDHVIANLPHKPGLVGDGLTTSEAGGAEGDALWAAAHDELTARQAPGASLWFGLHSLPHPRLLRRLGKDYELRLLAWRLRFIDAEEFGPLFAEFLRRHGGGRSHLHSADGRTAMVVAIYHGTRRGTAS